MNIDERLEALTQSVELLVSMHNERKRQFAENQRQFAEHQNQFAEHRNQFAEHRRLVSGAIESIADTNRQLTQMLAGMRHDQIKLRGEQQQDRQEFRDVMMRLSVIAEAHQDTLDDHERRLGKPAA